MISWNNPIWAIICIFASCELCIFIENLYDIYICNPILLSGIVGCLHWSWKSEKFEIERYSYTTVKEAINQMMHSNIIICWNLCKMCSLTFFFVFISTLAILCQRWKFLFRHIFFKLNRIHTDSYKMIMSIIEFYVRMQRKIQLLVVIFYGSLCSIWAIFAEK